MLSDTVSDLSTRIITVARLGVLELNHSVPVDERRLAQIGTSNHERLVLWNDRSKRDTAALPGSFGIFGERILGREFVLPTLFELSVQSPLELCRLDGERFLVALEKVVPPLLVLGTPGFGLLEVVVDGVGHDEFLLGVKAKSSLDLRDVILTQGGTVYFATILVDGANTDDGLDVDKDRLAGELLSLLESVDNRGEVVGSVLDLENVPPKTLELGIRVIGETDVNVTVHCDRVVVIYKDHVVKTPMSGHGEGYKALVSGAHAGVLSLCSPSWPTPSCRQPSPVKHQTLFWMIGNPSLL